jgi:hypothetical protein
MHEQKYVPWGRNCIEKMNRHTETVENRKIFQKTGT